MKKQITLIAALFAFGNVFSQNQKLANTTFQSATKNGSRSYTSAAKQAPSTYNTINSVPSFQENFDNIAGAPGTGPGTYAQPAGWSFFNIDGSTPATQVNYFTSAWVRRADFTTTTDTVLASTSWYTPKGEADDWAITPVITNLPANSVLTWNAKAQDPSFPDGYEVRIFTTAPTSGNLLNSTVEFTIASENATTWANRSINLNSYAGQNIYIAFRNNSYDQYILMIDDIVVDVAPPYDAQITSVDKLSQYSSIPLTQLPSQPFNFGATIKNNGVSDLTNVRLKLDILDIINNTVVYSDTSAAFATLTSGSSHHFTFSPSVPTTLGAYIAKYTSLINEVDSNTFNDTLYSNPIAFTSNTYARDDGNVIGALGIGNGSEGYIGQSYEITTAAQLNSVTLQYTRGWAGRQYAAVIFNTLPDGTPNSVIASTDTMIYANDSAITPTIPINGGPFRLDPGLYVIAAVEFDSTIALANTNGIFTDGTVWINWPENGWANAETFGAGFAKSFVIRPNISELTVGIKKVNTSHKLVVYPNPTSNILTIKNLEANSNITILNMLGQTALKTSSLSGTSTIDVSNLPNGIYFVEVITNNTKNTFKIVKE